MFLFGTFSHIILTIFTYQFYFKYAALNGGIGGTIISNIHTIIWIIIVSELVISLILIKSGIQEKG